MNTEKDSFPPTSIYNNSFKWLLAIVWLIALAGIAYFFIVQNNDKNLGGQKTTTNTQAPSPSTSLSTNNRIQPVAPSAKSQDVAGMENLVYTYVCHDLKIAPSRMQFRCRDGENFIDDIVWNEWKATGATGKGTLNQSDCSFGCKSPKYSQFPVTVKLSSPISDGKMVYFLRFDYLYVSASGREYAGVWDPTAVHDGRVF